MLFSHPELLYGFRRPLLWYLYRFFFLSFLNLTASICLNFHFIKKNTWDFFQKVTFVFHVNDNNIFRWTIPIMLLDPTCSSICLTSFQSKHKRDSSSARVIRGEKIGSLKILYWPGKDLISVWKERLLLHAGLFYSLN